MMRLLAAGWLWLAALVVPLVVLYILKIRRQRRKVASIWLWAEARRDLLARSPFRRLIWQLPLFLQAVALLLLALAAARPASQSRALGGDHLAILVDTSASMAAVDPSTGKRRIELAKEAAREMLAALAPGSDALLADAGRDARVVLPPERDVRRLIAAVDTLDARDVEGDLGGALALATSRLRQAAGRRRIVLLTDGNLARPLPPVDPEVPLELVRVGAPVDNAAIVRVDVRAGGEPERSEVQAFLLLASFAAAPRELYVTMRQENANDLLASRRVVLGPGERLPVVLTFAATPGDAGSGLVFDIAPHDALTVDDVAYGRVPPGRKLPVYVAAAGEVSPWLVRALVSDPDAEVRSGTLADLEQKAGDLPPDSLVVLEGACPPHPPGGDVLVVDPPAGACFGAHVGDEVDEPVVTSWEQADPRLRFVGLDGVAVRKARVVEPESQRQALVRTDRGVVAADVSTTARFATLLAFDPGETSWPLKASFVLFVRNVLEQARAHRQSGLGGAAVAGEPLRATLPSATRSARVIAPGGEPLTLPVRDGLLVVPEVARVGLHRLEWDEPRPGWTWVPVNLASADESDLLREPDARGQADTTVTTATEVLEEQEDWSWLLALAALAFVVIDVWYLTRKPRRATLASARPQAPERAA
jgi:hypothetical protein